MQEWYRSASLVITIWRSTTDAVNEYSTPLEKVSDEVPAKVGKLGKELGAEGQRFAESRTFCACKLADRSRSSVGKFS
jgi:hypothetical protein